ncbi:MAG TPA: hypothetical protein VLT47_10890 [Anaeromyxobacteraceae bacterium]|nr:hypothetical protein [Anaeromyxobacteraceae bacterium]
MRAYAEDDLLALKAKQGISALIEAEIVIDATTTIRLPLVPFTRPSFDEFADASLKDHASATEALLYRSIRFYNASEIGELRRACASLPAQVFSVLSADAGFPDPANPPSRYQVDAFDASTPPLVLELAGLDEATAAQLLAGLAGTPARVVSVIDQDNARIFGAVLAAPGEAEQHILAKARATQKGFGAAARSAAEGCLRWRSAGPDLWDRYPAIPIMCLADTIGDLGGGAATRRFRRR